MTGTPAPCVHPSHGALLAAHADEQYCYLTTRGRRSGEPHTIEIWFAADGGALYLLSGGGDRSDWVRNLLADPRASVALAGHDLAVTATLPLAEPAAERERAARLLHAKYSDQVSSTVESWIAGAYLVRLAPEGGRA